MIIHLYLHDRVAELQLSVLQHVVDASALETPKLTENIWDPVAGQREDDAHALKICCPGVPDETAEKYSLFILIESTLQHVCAWKVINDVLKIIPSMAAVIHIVSVEHVSGTVLVHDSSVQVWHTRAAAAMWKKIHD